MQGIVRISRSSTAAFSVIETVEQQVGPWWEDFKGSYAYFQETGHWPAANHPKFGRWVTSVNSHLRALTNGRSGWEGQGDYRLTADRLLALKAANYKPNVTGKIPSTPSGGVTNRIRTALEQGLSPDKRDLSRFWMDYNRGHGRESDATSLRKAGYPNPREEKE